jgi:hypothetical protein
MVLIPINILLGK